MLKFLTISGLVLSGGVAFGQFNYNNGPVVTLNVTEPYETADLECVPDSARDITINWELIEIENSIPPEWEFTICDYLCYPFFPSTGNGVAYTTQDWNDGSIYQLKLGITHNNINGEGSLFYYLFDADNPTNGDTIEFHLIVEHAGISGIQSQDVATISTSESGITVNTHAIPRTVRLINLDGSILQQAEVSGYHVFTHLTPGFYLICIDDQKTFKIYMNQ